MSHDYNDLRQTLIRARAQQDYQQMQRSALLMRGRLFTWLNAYRSRLKELGRNKPLNIAAYSALEHEPDLAPLLWQWVEEEGLTVSLPCVVAENSPLVFKLWDPDTPMKTAAFGVQEPDTDRIAPDPDIMLIPTLGLGWAVGDLSSYDYTPAEHDQPLHSVLTDKGWAVPAPTV